MVGFKFPIRKNTQESLIGKGFTCSNCGLYRSVISPKMKPFGKFKKKVLLIGEAPGELEDKRGKPWQGKAGQRLKRMLSKFGFNLFIDGMSTNTCCCRPEENRTPTQKEIACCRKNLFRTIKEHKPHVIIVLGGTALTALIGKYYTKKLGGMVKWRGFQIPLRELNAWVCPTYHPSYVMRNDNKYKGNLADVIWEQDIKKALECIKRPLKFVDEKECITYVESNKQFKEIIPHLLKAKYLSWDVETTGLKPHKKGHKIVTTAAAVSSTKCYVWMNNTFRDRLFRKVLRNHKIKKIAHNIQFENTWAKVILKATVQNWYWCTMQTAHILDNRRGITGLKFQTFVNFGVIGYDNLISPYLKAGDEYGANSFNNIQEFINKYGEREVMKYCGLDALFGFTLFLLQYKLIRGEK